MVWQKRKAVTPSDPVDMSRGAHAVDVPTAKGRGGRGDVRSVDIGSDHISQCYKQAGEER